MILDETQRNEMGQCINEVLICIRLCYCFYNWHKTVEPLLKSAGIYETLHQQLPDIKYGCFTTSLANIRKYDEFLFPRNKGTKADDIRADDFPNFCPSRNMLTKELRTEINKRLMHLTYEQVAEGEWDIAVRDVLPKIGEFQREFTAYVKANWPEGSPKYIDASSVDSMIDECLAFIRDDVATNSNTSDRGSGGT